jgi:hypothetical protein
MVVVVGRSSEKMRQALQVLVSAGFAATGTSTVTKQWRR